MFVELSIDDMKSMKKEIASPNSKSMAKKFFFNAITISKETADDRDQLSQINSKMADEKIRKLSLERRERDRKRAR
jgi:hypothetical protein